MPTTITPVSPAMSDKTVWFVTGASRGMGVNIVREALSAGHAVVATGRNADAVARAIGPADNLHIVKLDVTSEDDSKAAVADAVERFGCIDVLVNNAGNFYAGFFEELSPSDFRAQIETNFFGTVNVTRAVLPVMRAQRDGLIITISSTGGIVGQAFVSAYSAAKFALEGWMESLAIEIAPFGVRTMLVEPGFFRTELLTDESTKWPEPSIEDYADTTRETISAWKNMNGQQGGDPVKLAKGLVQLASAETPPKRWPAGSDAVDTFRSKANELLSQASANEALSSSLSYDTGT